MTRRNENSVLFSLGHLQQMAMATSGNARLSSPRLLGTGPVVTGPSDMPYVPVSVAGSTLMMTPRATWPRWLAPVIIGLGTLFIVFLVLALAIALRSPEVKLKPIVVPPVKAKAPVLTAQETPKASANVPAPETPPVATPIQPVTEHATDPAPTAEPTATTPKSKAKRRAALRRKRRRARARVKARARKRRARARLRKRRTSRRVASSTSAYKKKLGDAELDAILNVR